MIQPRFQPDKYAEGRTLFVIGLLLLCGLGCFWRFWGLDPPSLWLDDQWVAIVVSKMTWRQFIQLRPPVPIGFVAVLKLLASFLSDPEWPLQVFPAACSILQLPLLALLVVRATGRRSLGLLAAALLLVNPTVGTYAVRVKPFASDSLITILILLAGLPLLQRWTARRAVVVAATGIVALLFSFTSAFVSLPLLNLAVARRLLQGKDKAVRWRAISIGLAFNAAALLLYCVLLRGQSNDAMKAFWADFFLPLESAGAAFAFLYSQVLGALIGGAFPGPGWFLAGLLLIPPCAILIREPATRNSVMLFPLFYCSLAAASALHVYPVGTGRTDIFSYPITLLLLCLGLHVLTPWIGLGKYAGMVFVVLALVVVMRYGAASAYKKPCDDAQLVASLQRLAQDDDAVVIYPHGSFAVGYYSEWPMQIRPWDQYTHGFEVQFERQPTLTLRGYTDLPTNPERLGADLDRLLAARHQRIFYLAAYFHLPAHKFVHERIERAGYQAVDNIKAPPAQLIEYNAKSAR